MRNTLTILILALCGSLFAQVTKIDPARLVKPAGTANRMLITNGSSATAWGQASDLLVAGMGISISGNTISNTGVTGSGTAGRVAVWNSSTAMAGSTIYWDAVNMRVGVNVPSPAYTIDVDGAIHNVGAAFTTDYNSSGSPPAQWVLRGQTNTNQQMLLGYNTADNYGSVQVIFQGVGFFPLCLQPLAGNVGINTTSPSHALDVAGNARFRNAIYDATNSAGTPGYVLGTTGSVAQWTSPASIVTSGLGFVQNGNSFAATGVLGTNDANGLSIETNNIVRAHFDNSFRFRIVPVASDPASPTTGDTWLNDTDDRAVHHFTGNTRRVKYTDDDTKAALLVYREDFIKTNALPTLWTYNGDASTLSVTDYRFGYGSFAVSTNQLGGSANGFATLSQDADLQPTTSNFTYTMSAYVDLVNVPNTTNTGDIWIGIGGGNFNSISDPDDFVGFRVNPNDGSSSKYSFVIRKNGTSTSSSGGGIATGRRTLKIVWTNTSVAFYEDDVLLLNQTTMTNSPTGETGMGMMFKAKSAASATYPIAAVIASAIMKIDNP